jgi:hypothetical protein
MSATTDALPIQREPAAVEVFATVADGPAGGVAFAAATGATPLGRQQGERQGPA